MNQKVYWNDVAKAGVLLGILMSASKLLELSMVLSGDLSKAGWIVVEWVVFAALFLAVLFNATKKHVAKLDPKLSFGFGQGVSYMIMISIFAAVPVSCVYYVYINSIFGYEAYVEAIVSAITSFAKQAPLDNDSAQVIDQMIEQIRTQPQPSIFSSLMGTIFQYAFAGLFSGLILAGFTKRKEQIFYR